MYQLPCPDDHKTFEELIRDIFRLELNEPNFELYGRRGEKQDGIDGYHLIDGFVYSFQCKEKDVMHTTDDVLIDTHKKEMKKEAQQAKPFFERRKSKVKYFVFASTFKNSTTLQNYATELSEELSFPVVYWGWTTIREKIFSYPNVILPKYFPGILPDYSPSIEKFSRFITKSTIRDYQIESQQERLKLASSYYRINNNEEVLFRVICNNIDIPNEIVLEKAKNQIDSLSPKAAFWIVGNGGTGKSSLLIRLAVDYAQNDKKVFYLNFENPAFNREVIPGLISYILNKAKDQKAFLFVDNPDVNHDALEDLLRQAESLSGDIAVIFTERDIRLKLMQKENTQYCINGQEIIEPLKLVNAEAQRKIVYQQFYKLLGIENREIWDIIERFGVRTELAYVNSTYRILLELNKRNYIHYVFDWNEYENIVRKNCPPFLNGYRYIALFYLFGLDIPLSLINKLCRPNQSEERNFLATFHGEINGNGSVMGGAGQVRMS